ncbi:MAG: ABC transporter permease [Bacteroidales bacterium]
MRFPFFIARRYFFAKKSHNIINLISGISLVGVMIGTMSLVTVLSVFNGFETLVTSLFNSFNADYQITAVEGKTFESNAIEWSEIKSLPGVKSVNPCLEEKALIIYKSKQVIATLKGVESGYGYDSGLDTMLVDGDFVLERNNVPFGVCGYGVAYQLDLVINDQQHPLEIYFPRKKGLSSVNPADAFNFKQLSAAGVFSVQQEFDLQYVFIPLKLMTELVESPGKLTSVEIRIDKQLSVNTLHARIAEIAGTDFVVKNRFQQEELLFKIMRSEKWAIFLILTFILIIATFNVIGSLTMLILEKKKDISILSSLGAHKSEIRRIFLLEGWLISFIGSLSGLFIGFILCWLQQHYGIVRLGETPGTFLVQAYPVSMNYLDFLGVFITVNIIGFIAAWFPSKRISQRYLENRFLST